MNKIDGEFIVISVGGSIIIPDEIDTTFLKEFKRLILEEVKAGRKFVLIIGGGKTCRKYQAAAADVVPLTTEDMDWIGIYSTRFNAQFMRYIFKGFAYGDIIADPSEIAGVESSIIIGAGWEPGWSTDYDAVTTAEFVGAKKLINLSNIDYVYDSDPKKNPNARPVDSISWQDYRKLIPGEWSYGLNTPFDPIASKKSEELNLEVAIMNGANLDNLRNYLAGNKFIGTVIRSLK